MKILKTANYKKLAQPEKWKIIDTIDALGQKCDGCGIDKRGYHYKLYVIQNDITGETKQVGDRCLGPFGIRPGMEELSSPINNEALDQKRRELDDVGRGHYDDLDAPENW
jgi:hypothetical protein